MKSKLDKQAPDRAEKEGIATVGRDFGLAENQRYAGRQKQRLDGLTTKEQKRQQAELARLKREMARRISNVQNYLQ